MLMATTAYAGRVTRLGSAIGMVRLQASACMPRVPLLGIALSSAIRRHPSYIRGA